MIHGFLIGFGFALLPVAFLMFLGSCINMAEGKKHSGWSLLFSCFTFGIVGAVLSYGFSS